MVRSHQIPPVMTAAAHSVLYVYGVVPSSFEMGRAPDGVEDAALRLVASSGASALVSDLDSERYAPTAVERATEDVEWLAPRAVAHDRVLTWASDRGPVVPLPMFSLFSSDDAVRAMLDARRGELTAALERAARGREYTLRIYRVDEELIAVAVEHSPRLAELQRSADAASPGQRYLLLRKLETERKAEVRMIAQQISREVIGALSRFALGVHENPTPRRDGGTSSEVALVLDAAFLVSPDGYDTFQRELTAIVTKYKGRGFRFDFTGPWPPYHFVQDTQGASERE